MRKFYILILSVLLLIGFASVTAKNTVHLIIISDDHAVGIGSSCKKDAQKISLQWSSLISLHPQLNPKFHKVNNSFLTRKYVINLLNGLNTQDGDIIFFYFTGHGFWNTEEKDTYMKLGINGGIIGLKEVKKILECKASNARYYITDCCKKDLNIRTEPLESPDLAFCYQDIPNIEDLLAFQGIIEVTSCRRNQISYTMPNESGSFFTATFINILWGEIRNSQKVSWKQVLKITQSTTKQNVKQYSRGQQEPHYIIHPL